MLLLFKISHRECGMPEAFLPTRRAGREITNILVRIWGVCASHNTNLLSDAEEDAVNLRHLLDESYFSAQGLSGWKLNVQDVTCDSAHTPRLHTAQMSANERVINVKSQLIHSSPLLFDFYSLSSISSSPRSSVYQKQFTLCLDMLSSPQIKVSRFSLTVNISYSLIDISERNCR